jgi:hypothetical protein
MGLLCGRSLGSAFLCRLLHQTIQEAVTVLDTAPFLGGVWYAQSDICAKHNAKLDRLSGLVVRVLGYRSGGPGSIPGTTKKKK